MVNADELAIDVEIERTSTVRLLKELIRRSTRGVPGWENFEPQNQRLIFGGGILAGGVDDKVLNEIQNLVNGSVIQLMYRPVERNGGQGRIFTLALGYSTLYYSYAPKIRTKFCVTIWTFFRKVGDTFDQNVRTKMSGFSVPNCIQYTTQFLPDNCQK